MSTRKRIRRSLISAVTLAAIVLTAISIAGCGGGGGGGGTSVGQTGTVSGVALEGNAPVTGAAVWLDGVKTSIVTGSLGTFTLTAVPAGHVDITIVNGTATGTWSGTVTAGMTVNPTIVITDGPPGPPPMGT
jgi:hypothetical protein